MPIGRTHRTLLAASALTLALSACSSSGSGSNPPGGGASDSTIKVLAILDNTGPTKFVGAQEEVGLRAATKYFNAHGGIAGHPLELTVQNDNGNPATSASLAIKALSSSPGEYTMVYAGSEGATISALIPIMQKFDVLAISLNDGDGTCATASKCPQQFSELGTPDLPVKNAASWIRSKGYHKAGILQEAITFTETETPTLKSELSKAGIATSTASFGSDAVDLTSEMSALRSAGADVVYAEANGPAAGYALKARAALNWNVPVLFDPAGSASDITKLVPAASDIDNAFVTVCRCANPSASVRGITAMLTAAPSGSITQQISLAGFGWDAFVLLQSALEHSDSTDPKKLVSALESLDSAQQRNPLYITTTEKSYTSANHENVGAGPSDYSVVGVGPIENGRVQAP